MRLVARGGGHGPGTAGRFVREYTSWAVSAGRGFAFAGTNRTLPPSVGGLADLDLCPGDDRLQHVRAEAIAPEVVKHAAHWKRCRFAVDKPISGAALLVGSAVHLFDYPAILVDGLPARISCGLATFSREHSARAAPGRAVAATKTAKTIVASSSSSCPRPPSRKLPCGPNPMPV